MTLAMRYEPEIAQLQQSRFPVCDLEPAPASRYDVKHQGAWYGRQLQPPRRGELAAAVEAAPHAQHVQRFTEWLD